MTLRDEDVVTWRMAVEAFRDRALADIEAEAGVSRSVSRRLKEGADPPQFLHERTRTALRDWRKRNDWREVIQSLPANALPLDRPPGRPRAPLPTPTVPPMSDESLREGRLAFHTERERLHVIQQAIRSAERYRQLLGAELEDALAAIVTPVATMSIFVSPDPTQEPASPLGRPTSPSSAADFERALDVGLAALQGSPAEKASPARKRTK